MIKNASNRYHNQLLSYDYRAKKALRYLFDRGLTIETIKKWKIGLSFSFQEEQRSLNWDDDELVGKPTYQSIKMRRHTPIEYSYSHYNSHISISVVKKVNKSKTKTNKRYMECIQNKYYPNFYNRIMIPFHDINNNVIGFTGRTTNDRNKNIAKYKNSLSSDLYDKSSHLFGLEKWNKEDSVIIVESQLNVIALEQIKSKIYEEGLPVGLGGTSLTDAHIKLLKDKGIRNVTLMRDPDKAGMLSSYKLLPKLINNFIVVSVVVLPRQKDVMDLIRETDVILDKVICSYSAYEFIYKYIDSLPIHERDRELDEVASLLDPKREYCDFGNIPTLYSKLELISREDLNKYLPYKEDKTYKDFMKELSKLDNLIFQISDEEQREEIYDYEQSRT